MGTEVVFLVGREVAARATRRHGCAVSPEVQ